MKKITLLIALVTLTIGLFAQTLTLSYSGGVIPDGGSISYTTDINTPILSGVNVFVHNTGSAGLNILCKKEIVDTISGTKNSFCWGFCFPDTVYISDRNNPIFIAAGDSTDETAFSGEYNPHGQSGDSHIRYTFFDKNDEANKVSVIITYRATPVSVSNYTQNPSKLSISPNPASNQTTIDYAFNNINNIIVVRNLIGGTVYTSETLNSTGKLSINTSDFTDGIYFVTFLSNNVPQSTKKLIIKH